MTASQQHHILLVEDEPTNVLLIRRAIGKVENKIQLQTVENGEQAVSYLKQTKEDTNQEYPPLPNLIVTDIKMPRMNGLEFLAWIKQQPEFANLPVVVLSSSGDPDDINQASALGASSYFVRPGSTSELVNIMKQILAFIPASSA